MLRERLGDGDETGDEPRAETAPSTNEMFDVLSGTQRRQVLHYLADGQEVATLGEIAEWVAAQEDGDAERIAIALHHGHLPKLTDVGLIEYDPADRTVEPCAELASVAPYLPQSTDR